MQFVLSFVNTNLKALVITRAGGGGGGVPSCRHRVVITRAGGGGGIGYQVADTGL